MDELVSKWLATIRAMTGTADDAARYLDRRLLFTTEVARALSHDDSALDSLVYGVWLEGHESPIYIGQTTEGRRRLWDLPIGESHHLANSFPPEIWGRVAVVYWGRVQDNFPGLAANLAAELQPLLEGEQANGRQAIGLGLEFLLQREFQPLFNRRKKKRDGSWRPVDWKSSESLGARVAPFLGQLYAQIAVVWQHLLSLTPDAEGCFARIDGGRVVFPACIRKRMWHVPVLACAASPMPKPEVLG